MVGDDFGIFGKLFFNETPVGNAHFFLRQMGFVHLLSASGIHLYALFEVSRLFSRVMLRRFGMPGYQIERVADAAAGLWVFYAWSLSGWRMGLLRPFFIVGVRWLAQSRGLRFRRLAPLFLALVLEGGAEVFTRVVHEAEYPLTGRLHYALAVGFGLLAYECARGKGVLYQHAGLAVGSWFGTAPLDLWESGTIAFWTPVLSLLTIPAFASIGYPVGLLLYLMDDSLFQMWIKAMQHALEAIIRAAATLPVWMTIGRFGVCVGTIIACAGLAFGLQARGMAVLALVGTLIARLFALPGSPTPAAWRVVQWDVGQGDSALVRYPGEEDWLLDVGSARFPLKGWVQRFGRQGIVEFEGVALTHLDEDHAGRLPRLLQLYPVKAVWISKAYSHDRRLERIRVAADRVNVPIRWIEKHPHLFPFEWQPLDLRRAREGARNYGMLAFSAALSGGGIYLNAGDADSEQESKLHARLQQQPRRVRFFKVSHHGSRFASRGDFARTLAPEQAWISCGANRYGHPAPEALRAWSHVSVRRTDRDGSIVWTAGWRQRSLF